MGNGDPMDVAYGTLQETTDTALGTADDILVSAETPAITIDGTLADGELCYFKVSRDPANDTCTDDARLLGLKLIYTVDALNDA